ncbi:MAG: sensor histidine kinase [Solirubrobacteraceae bacterium]
MKYDSLAVVPLVAAVVSALATAGFVLGWAPHLSAPGARVALETGITLAALAAAGLLLAQYRRRHRVHELLLMSAVAAVALTDFLFSALPPLIGTDELPLDIEAKLALQTAVPVMFAIAAFGRARMTSRRPWWKLLPVGGACIAIIAAAEIAGLIVGSSRTTSGATGLMLEVDVLTAAVFAGAGIGFLRRPSASGGNLLMGGASFLLAASRLQSAALSLAAASWITPRDLLRLVAYGLLLAGTARDQSQLREEDELSNLARERERIARDLHDGLAQDLAVIAVHGQRMQQELGAEHPVTVAARRALAASRSAIVDLSASRAPSTAAALREVATELETRFDIDVAVREETQRPEERATDLGRGDREQFVRIAREAIVNAARHGRAHHVDVVLSHHGAAWRLTIADDGSGISRSQLASPSGFGLRAMRARAQELGGRLAAGRGASGGTVLELSLPAAAGDPAAPGDPADGATQR